MITFLQIAGGLFLLFLGGELLVRAAVTLAERLGIPKLVIALTVVAVGTSAPEIIVSVQAALNNSHEIAIGNIVGSNIANIALVLGLTALIAPVHIDRTIIRRDGPVMLAVALLMTFFFYSGAMNIAEGLILIGMLGIYIFYTIKISYAEMSASKASTNVNANTTGMEPDVIKEEISELETLEIPSQRMDLAFLILLAGTAALAFGSDILVTGASDLARIMGLSEAVIGLTIVAIGSSSPELATCVMAAKRGHADIAAGNIVGSNIFNVLMGISSASLFATTETGQRLLVITPELSQDMMAMALLTIIFMAIMHLKANISRLTGGIFFAAWVSYIAFKFI